MDIYEDLFKNAGSLKDAAEDSSGLDSFLLPDKIKVASLGDLSDFFRVAATDTLIHKAEKDLWRISEDKGGQVIIERLFNPYSNQPLKV